MNNGKDGLLRMSMKQKLRLCERFANDIMVAKNKHDHFAPVRFELVRHSVIEPDYDGLVASGKLILDQLTTAGLIPDDNSNVITEREYTWTKALNNKSQFTVIRLIDLPNKPTTG